ncbi:MAG: biopolymer transporter ExbD [Nitrospirae bacterium]|nr:biopolymer transporter ExbD [Nitrospirota bacterium]MBI5695475.1 biopolymer transporter ExbD [Nitrospirota bacterium]
MDEKNFDYINVVPFIDIMLVLLTIVLTASTFIASGGIPLDLPKASAARQEVLKTETIEVGGDGSVWFNSRPTSVERLRACLGPLDRATPILIRADRAVALQAFVDVLDMVKRQGFKRVSLQTEDRT